MSDSNETILDLKRFPEAARTVVMPCPPRMTANLNAMGALELEFGEPEPVTIVKKKPLDPRATRLAAPALTHAIPRPAASFKIAHPDNSGMQTRMAAPPPPQLVPPLLPLPSMAAPPPPPPGTRQSRVPVQKKSDSRKLRPILMGAAGLLVIGLVMVLPLSGPSAGGQPAAAESAQGEESNAAEASDALVAPKLPELSEEKAGDTSPSFSEATEEQAAALLLDGRRQEALEIYQELSKEEDASPGIEAMVVVLSQKVDTP